MATSLEAQTVLLNQEVDSNKMENKVFGANQRNFIGYSIGLGPILGRTDETVQIAYGRSVQFASGIFYKRKLSRVFAIGGTFNYTYSVFALQKNKAHFTDSFFWDSAKTHMTEKFGIHGLQAGIFLRINFDPGRGNKIGNYLDLGAEGGIVANADYVTKDKLKNDMLVKTKYSNLIYNNLLQEYVYAKFGSGILGLSLHYRISDFFKSEYNIPEFPPFVLRLELSY